MKTAIDLIDDPLHDLRKVAVRYDLPMPGLEAVEDAEGNRRYADDQWPKAFWAHHWFFPNEAPAVRSWGADGEHLVRHSYEGPTNALESILTVPGGTGYFVIEELVAEFLVTRLVHDPLYWAEINAWTESGKQRMGPEWAALGEANSWSKILAAKDDWNLWFAELVAHIAEAAGLVEIGYSIYSSALTDRAKAWALLIRVNDKTMSGEDYAEDYAALLAMGADQEDDA